MRDSHRGEAERLLVRAVEEEVRRAAGTGAPADRAALLARGREALDGLAVSAAAEYEAYVRALDEAAAGDESLGEAFRRGNTSTALLVTAVAAAAAVGADLALGVAPGTALTAGAVVGVAGAAATVAKVTALHLPAASRRAGALGQPGGPEQLRLQWLTALEVRGIRPFLEQQRAVAAAARAPRAARVVKQAAPQLRGGDRSAEARRRSALEQSFGQLPQPVGEFAGRRTELTRIAQWVQAARASTETRPVVVVLHGEPGVGRTALALRAAHGLRDQFRGACVVDLRGGEAAEAPLSTREALLHLLNRLGAPREQLLFREGASAEQQVRRLGELYHQHLQGLPVTVVLDDAVDAAQVRMLVPERSDSLVLVTARDPLELPADLTAWVHQLPVERLPDDEATELVRAGAGAAGAAVAGAEGRHLGADTGRGATEAGRLGADTGHGTTDARRLGADTGRGATDTGRLGADAGRGTTDTGRHGTDAGRGTTDTGRGATETGRLGAEGAGAGAEAAGEVPYGDGGLRELLALGAGLPLALRVLAPLAAAAGPEGVPGQVLAGASHQDQAAHRARTTQAQAPRQAPDSTPAQTQAPRHAPRQAPDSTPAQTQAPRHAPHQAPDSAQTRAPRQAPDSTPTPTQTQALAQTLPEAPAEALQRALDLAYLRLPDERRRLLRRLTLAGRVSLGPSAAAALADADQVEAGRLLRELAQAGLLDHVRGERYRMHDAVRSYAAARLTADEDPAEAAAAHERLIRNYAQLADSVIRMVDGKMSTRANHFGGHGFASLDAALRWLDDESSFITAALRHSEGVDQQAVLDLLGALCDFCLLRGDLYRLGEIDELTRAVDRGRLARSVQWRTGIAARQLGELDKARTTLTSVVDQYMAAQQEAGAGMALISLGITLHHQGQLEEAGARIREALVLQEPEELAGDRAWGLHALAAVERDLGRLGEAMRLLERSLALHRESESVHGEAWAHFQLGQVYLRIGDVGRAEAELRLALDLYGRTRDDRGEAWALTQLGRARVLDGDPGPAVERLREALARHREAEDARGEAWTLYHLGQALEEGGELDQAVRELERARTMFSRMRDVYGLAHARHHSGRVSRDQRAAQTGNLRNSGFARQLLVDARADFRRIGLAHGEAWTCLELSVVDAGNGRVSQALGLCEEAVRLFISYGDRRGEDWGRFLRCTMLPYVVPPVPGAPEEARAELARLAASPHPARDARLEDCLETYGVILGRGVDPAEDWQAWRLGMVPALHAREIMGVPLPPAS
ncbi:MULTISPECIES: tetratricopeptide repeat protein [unclassified Streptomyces]|uniref:tetratricopeptide repeat protein n=1 Tax=unclassified Streptomyces TaxID=2593676 RepID=UPI00203533D2|nr:MULTISPECIES: tetratricopeptide repeat protein [unclassified Streptomyces]